jgi:hypothetical protein
VTVYQPLYRLTVYSPRSIDIDEATVLVPRAGALHSNPFRVSTKDHGRAVRFGSTSRYMLRNPVGTWPTTSFSLEGYARVDAGQLGVSHFLFSYAVASGSEIQAIQLRLASVAGPNLRLQGTVNNVDLQDADNYSTDGKYHHIAFTWQSSDGAAKLYIDGVQAHSGTIATGYSMTGGGAAAVGIGQSAVGGSFSTPWIGELDEVRLYRQRVLTPAEVKQHAGGIYIDETGLCGRWGFDLDGVPALGRDSAGLNDLTPVGIDAGTDDTILHFKPYLRDPEGITGEFDPLSRVLNTGYMTAGLIDRQITPGDNLSRYITQYLGDVRNRNQLLGLKARWEESLDNGFIWASYFTGRMDLTKLAEKNAYSIPCRDGADELNDADVFVERPHSSLTYTAPAQVWPQGPPVAYGALQPGLPIKGKIQAATGFPASAGIKAVIVDANEHNNPRNQLTKLLEDVSGYWMMGNPGLTGNVLSAFFPEGVTYSTRARIKLKRLDNSNSGQFQLGVVRRGSNVAANIRGAFAGGLPVYELVLAEVPATDPAFLAMPPNGTAVECSVILIEKPTVEAPLYINDTHAVQLIEDLVLGKFGWLQADGSVLQAFTPEPTSFATLKADLTIPTFRGRIEKKDKLLPFLKRALLRPPYNLGLRLDADNRVVVFDTRRPSSLAGVATIANTDLIEVRDAFQWEQSRQDAITQLEAFYYVDVPIGVGGDAVTFDSAAMLHLRAVQQPYLDVTFGRADMGQKRELFDVIGFRAMPGELIQGQSRLSYIRRQLERGLEEIRTMFSSGPAYATLRCRRTANTNGWQVGQLRIVDVDPMPDPTSNLRGGARVMMAVKRNARQFELNMRVVDLGPNVIAAAPTLSGLATDTDDTAHGISLTLTLNAAGDPIEMHYAVTASGVGVRPVETDPLWTFGKRVKTTGAIKVINLPAGMKIWVRARSIPGHDAGSSNDALRFPSVWAFPGTDNVTLASLAAPSALGDTEVTGRRFVVTFTPGDTRLPTEVLLATPTSDPRVRVKTLPPGATRVELVDLELSTTYRVGLRHRDSLGGLSTEVTRDVTTTGSAATAPNPGGIAIVIGAA